MESIHLSFSNLSPRERNKLLTGLIIPRPIALVTTVSSAGVVNAAPFSFFNVFAHDPPTIVLGIERRRNGAIKDTERNLNESKDLVVNMVDEGLLHAMNDCAIDFPAHLSEPVTLGLSLTKGVEISVPHLTNSPCSIECRQTMNVPLGPVSCLIVCEVLGMHLRPGVIDQKTLRADEKNYETIGRLMGLLYAKPGKTFTLPRETFLEWNQKKKRFQKQC